MTVRVHHAGDHQAACRFDHLSGFGRGLQIRADGSDEAVCHQDVARGQVAQVRVDGHDVAALYQQFFHVFHGAVPACPPSKTYWCACHTVEVSGTGEGHG
jgi:hypothetical protein